MDVVYFHMWLEEEFPYYEIKFGCDSLEYTEYNELVLNAIREWQKMKEKRENLEISDEEYLERKLNFMNDTIKLEISGKNKSDCFLVEHIE